MRLHPLKPLATAATLFALALGLAADASACSAGRGEPRRQATLYPDLAPGPARPVELRLRPGDLISVPDRPGDQLRTLDGPPAAAGQPRAPALVLLDDARFRELALQGGGSVVPEPQLVNAEGRPLMTYRRYGVPAAGVYWLAAQRDGMTWLARIQADEPPPRPQGEELVVAETAGADKTIWLDPRDRLVLDLPGQVGDGWRVSVDGSVAPVRISAAAAGRVRIELGAAPSARPDGSFEITVGTGLFHRLTFRGRLRPIPTC